MTDSRKQMRMSRVGELAMETAVDASWGDWHSEDVREVAKTIQSALDRVARAAYEEANRPVRGEPDGRTKYGKVLLALDRLLMNEDLTTSDLEEAATTLLPRVADALRGLLQDMSLSERGSGE